MIIDMGNSKIAKIYIKSDFLKDYKTAKPFISKLAKVENVEFVNEKVPCGLRVCLSTKTKSIRSNDE